MQVRFRSSVVLVLVAAASLAIHADGPSSQAADVQYQLGTCSIPKAATSRPSRRSRTP